MLKKMIFGVFSLLIVIPAATALAHEGGPGQQIQDRLDHKGNQINQHLDRKGDRVENRLDRKGDKMNQKLDRKGRKTQSKIHKKDQKLDRKMHNTGFQHGMSQALNNGKGKKKGLHRKMH